MKKMKQYLGGEIKHPNSWTEREDIKQIMNDKKKQENEKLKKKKKKSSRVDLAILSACSKSN